MRARTARIRFLDEPGEGRFFRVYASVLDGHAVGGIISVGSNAAANMREVASNDCSEVVSALALIVALAVDPQASTTVSLTVPPPGEPEQVPIPAPAPPRVSPMAPQAFSAAPATSAWVDSTGKQKPTRSSDIALGVGARVEGAFWWSAGPIPMGAWALSVEGENTESRLVAPTVRLSLEHRVSAAVNRTEGGARFAITAGRLDACPFRVRLAPSISLRPCVGLEAGRLSATGLAGPSVLHTLTQQRPWWALEQSVRAQFWLTQAWATDIEAGFSEPLWRDEFVLTRPTTGAMAETVAKTPIFVPKIGFGASVHFQ